jgi:hypothetical protein
MRGRYDGDAKKKERRKEERKGRDGQNGQNGGNLDCITSFLSCQQALFDLG